MSTPSRTQPRVLIVDDDPLVRNLLRAVLETGQFNLSEAEDGQSALLLADEIPPDVVVLDVMMPGASGLDVCATMRADPRFDRTRILMLTARGTDHDRESGLAAGADAYFTKPFSPLDLIASITEGAGGPA